MSTKLARRCLPVAALLVAVTVAACGSSSGGAAPSGSAAPASAGTTASAGATAGASTGRTPDGTLDVLVTNDDGVGSAGIDAVAHALAALPNTSVHVVAPAANQSGTGGKTSGGQVSHEETTTTSGLKATAVSGYPADAVHVALDELGLKPDLVVSGVNEGQNLGPVVNLSGTVGAARAAAQRGIPALAVSEGLGDTYDYSPAVTQVLAWVSAHRTGLLAAPAAGGRPASEAGGAATALTVANLNVPNCFAGGKVRGLREVASEATLADMSAVLKAQSCTATDTPQDEVGAFNAGFATLTTVPARPPA
ncbi:5'/3'-nucleotidase SurE [Frankia sp. R82]|uniref:5'/3'-nucleotidase SurE n=1 Tax=Frankia sp. R82 TaxID=2950553 RepID=UPI002043C9E9|nr:5'/3'-nucleotidase SurE [Frankia sp. R82]MCM3882725.1 5'/3'-nucleotidase SurE [Frankia sp. R82]